MDSKSSITDQFSDYFFKIFGPDFSNGQAEIHGTGSGAHFELKKSLIEVTQFWMDQEVTSKWSHIIVSGVLYGHESNDHRVMEKEPF